MFWEIFSTFHKFSGNFHRYFYKIRGSIFLQTSTAGKMLQKTFEEYKTIAFANIRKSICVSFQRSCPLILFIFIQSIVVYPLHNTFE